MQEIIKESHMTGACLVDIEALEKAWDHRFLLSQWKDEYRLIKYLRKGSGKTEIKCAISYDQAQKIIERLQLVRTQSMFASGGAWSKAGFSEMDMLRNSQKKMAA